MKHLHSKATLSLVIFCLLSSVIGYSSWIIYNPDSNTRTQTITTTEEKKVCFIGSTYYTSIEKAISVANSSNSNVDVWVIPGTFYTIKSGFTINNNVTLNLPFQDNLRFEVWKTKYTTVKDENGKDKDVSDNIYDWGAGGNKVREFANGTIALDEPEKYRTTQITIGKDVQIINNGTINVGGVIGGQGGPLGPCGQTCYKYAEIYCDGMSDGQAQIKNNGLIKNQGSITGDDDVFAIENNSGSTLKSVMVIGENRGGSALVELGGGYGAAVANKLSFKCSPFNTVYMPNIKSKVRSNQGSNIIGLGAMYGNNSHNQVEINLYGDKDSYLLQSNGGYLISNCKKDAKNNDLLILDFYGNHAINYFKISLSVPILGNRDIKTDTVLFPLSYVNEVNFHSINNDKATVTSTQDIKVMPGGKLTIGTNVEFNINQLAVYDKSFVDPLTNGVTYPTGYDDGLFLLNGTANINNFGGYAITDNDGSILNIKNSNMVESKQIVGNPANGKCDPYNFYALGDSFGVKKDRLYVVKYQSANKEWICEPSVSIESLDGLETPKRTAKDFRLKATILPNGIKSKVTSFKWKTRRKNNRVSKDGSFKNETIEGCTYHLDENENWSSDNITYVTLEIYINGSSEPIVSNTLTITGVHRFGI